MVSGGRMIRLLGKPGTQIGLVTFAAMVMIGWQASRAQNFLDLWLTADQQGWLALRERDWEGAVNAFEDPAWTGVAAYRGGMYEASADAFGRVASARGQFNRGDALMKAGEYRKAVRAFELAVAVKPDWTEAQENLDLATYTLGYVERTREQSGIGEHDDMGADEFRFDNEEQRGQGVEITRDSALGMESAEKWMRAVDTNTTDFLRIRFQLEAAREAAP